MIRILCTLLVMIPGLARAEGIDHEDYVANNILAIFYHEMGHALIHTMDLPIFGQEEDAADVLSILMIHDLFNEDAAVQIAYDTADNFAADAERTEEVAYWDTHGPDLQRYYTTVCLFIGGNYEGREDMAEELQLPEERLVYCEEEFELAYGSWGSVLDELMQAGNPGTFEMSDAVPDSTDGAWLHDVVSREVESLNKDFKLPEAIAVRVEDCGEPNAFYDGNEKAIVMCTEFVAHLESNLPPQ